jgi:hypothetical protein
VEAYTGQTRSNANQTGEIEVDLSYSEEGFLCRRRVSDDLEHPRNLKEEKAETVGKT